MDNNSTDGSPSFFFNRFPQVNFIWKNENAGFAKANNEALKLAKGEKILFLNPDTILPEDGLEKCLQFLDRQKNAGALGVKMIDGSGNFLPESKRGFPTFFTSFCKMTGLTRLFPRSKIFANYYMGHLAEDTTNEVDVLSGAFMIIDKKVLDSVGSFNENYFMYAEDIDLSYRIQKAGYSNYYFADTAIIHFKGESTVKQSADRIRNFYGTMIIFVQQHYGKLSGNLYALLLKMIIAVKIFFAGFKTMKTKKATVHFNRLTVMGSKEDLTKLEPAVKPLCNQFSRQEGFNNPIETDGIILCEPFISFKDIINQLQQHKNRYYFLIHTGGTASAVGSGNKNETGTALVL